MAEFWNSDFLAKEEDAFQYSGNDHMETEPLLDLSASEFSDLCGLLDCDGISAGHDRVGALNQPDQILIQSSFSIGSQINQLEYLGPHLPDPFRSAQYFSLPSNTMGPQTNQPESLGPELFSSIHSAQLFGQPSNSMGPQNQKEHFGAQHPDPIQSAEPFSLPCDFMGPTNQPNPEQLSEAVKRVQKAAKRKIVDKKHYDKKKQMKKEMEDKIEDLNETIKSLMGRIGNLEEGKERYEANLISLTKATDELISDLEKSESINKDQENLVQDLLKQLDQMRSKLEKSESKRLEQDYRIICLEEQVEKLRSELARQSSDKNYLISLLPYNSPEPKRLRKAQANRQKVILKLELHDGTSKRKALKTVSDLSGVESISMDMKDKKLTVIGDVDAVGIVQKLRKVCFAELISVGPAKEPEKKKEGPKKEDEDEDEEPKKEEEEPKKKEDDDDEAEREREEPKKKEGEEPKKKEEEEQKKADEMKDAVADLVKAFEAYSPYITRHYYVRSVEKDTNARVIC